MLEIKDLNIKIKEKYIIKNLTFTLNKNDKLAIIGEEGNGKTTLVKTIMGLCNYAEIEGIINLKGNKIGYLEQNISEENLYKKVYSYIFENENEYYEKIKDLYKYLKLFDLKDTILKSIINNLSGGEKVKINIIKLILQEADILILDEPTNDLDIETLEWLENFINTINKPIIYISHDETLLSKTANIILHIEQIKKKTESRHTIIRTDYNNYIEERLKSIDKQTQIHKNEKREFNKSKEKLQRIMQKVENEQNTISRKNPHGAKLLKKKMHSLKSQEKKLNNITTTEKPDIEESINFFFDNTEMPKRKIILKLNIPKLYIENKLLSENINLEIYGNEHICIIGKNGSGKTTLIKEIYNELKIRKDIIVGYMPQNYDDILNKYEYVLDYICKNKSKEEITNTRQILGNMKLTKEEMEGKIKDLSLGTKAKLILIKLVNDKCNVLILDEPTRNVSPLSNPVIRKVLKEFKGTIISVSHDRKYIEEVVTVLYNLSKNGLVKQKTNITNKL